MIPPFVISLDLGIDINGKSTEERNSPDGLAAGDRPDELRQSAVSPVSHHRTPSIVGIRSR
jgi:hypothetical protein